MERRRGEENILEESEMDRVRRKGKVCGEGDEQEQGICPKETYFFLGVVTETDFLMGVKRVYFEARNG